MRRGVVSPQKKSGALAGRLGVRPGISVMRNFTTFCIRSESGTGLVINSNFLAGCRFCRNCRRCKKQDWDREDFRRQVCQGFFLPFCGKVFHFFRDVLAAKGKGLDARQKLEKMRNLKVGS